MNDAIEREIKQYGTLVHGDVKSANILLGRSVHLRRTPCKKGTTSKNDEVVDTSWQCALYDLQYVGLGLVTYDLVYFLTTATDPSLLEPASEKELLQAYLAFFHTHADSVSGTALQYDFATLWNHWELAIIDWYRFMAGWGFWGHDNWVEKRAREIVAGRIESLVS